MLPRVPPLVFALLVCSWRSRMKNDPSEEQNGTKRWIVKLSYRLKPELLKGSKGWMKAKVGECMLYIKSRGVKSKEGRGKHPKNCHGLESDIPPFIKHLVLSSKPSLHMVLFGPASLSLPHRFPPSHHPSWLLLLLPYFDSRSHPFPSTLCLLSSIYHPFFFSFLPLWLPAFQPARRS